MAAILASITTTRAHQVMLWSAILAAAVIVLFLAVWYYRKRWLGGEQPTDEVWDLDDLRRMRAKNLISEEEYTRLRSAIIGAFSKKGSGADKPAVKHSEADWDWVAEAGPDGRPPASAGGGEEAGTGRSGP